MGGLGSILGAIGQGMGGGSAPPPPPAPFAEIKPSRAGPETMAQEAAARGKAPEMLQGLLKSQDLIDPRRKRMTS